MSTDFDPMDFHPNSVGVLVVRVIRLQDIVKALRCTEEFAREVVREIRGETSADGEVAFVLPSQLAAWAYKRAGKPVAPFPFKSVLVQEADERGDALKRAATRAGHQQPATPASGSTSLKEIRSDLRRMKAATIQPGALAITVEQAAARLGCSRSQVFEELRAGRLVRARKTGRKTMLTLASVDGLHGIAAVKGTRPRVGVSQGAAIKAAILRLKRSNSGAAQLSGRRARSAARSEGTDAASLARAPASTERE